MIRIPECFPRKLFVAGFAIGTSALHCLSAMPADSFQGSIKDFVLMALENNQELEVRRFSPQIQEEVVNDARSILVPVFVAEVMHEQSETNVDQRTFNSLFSSAFGPTNPTSIYEERNTTYKVGFEGLLPYGTQYQFSVLNRELNNDSNLFETEYKSEAALTFTQPLLQGFGKDVTMAEVRLAESDLQREEFRLKGLVNAVLRNTMTACVEMIFAQKNLEVKDESIALAEALLADNRKSFELGRMNEIDVLQAEARVSEAIEERLQAETFLIERTNDLKALIVSDFSAAESVEVRVFDDLNTDYSLPSKFELLEAALANNADFLAARQFVESQGVVVDIADNRLKPQVDLIGRVSYNGLDFENNFTAIGDYADRDSPSWMVGVTVSYPIGNHSAKALQRKAMLQKRQAESNVNYSRVELSAQLDSALKVVEIAQARISISQKSVGLARKTLEAEEKRLKLGTTTSYNVAEMQRNLSVAQTRSLAATVEYEKALIELWGIIGVLNERMNVSV